MTDELRAISPTRRSTHGDLSDEEWELISDLVPSYSGPGRIGRPTKWSKRDVVNAILYVAATGCQLRALPACYPQWNTVHRYHVTWSEDRTSETICRRLTELVRTREGRDPDASAGVIDARSVRGAATVTSRPGDMTQARRSRAGRPSASSTRRDLSSPSSSSRRASRTTPVASPRSSGREYETVMNAIATLLDRDSVVGIDLIWAPDGY